MLSDSSWHYASISVAGKAAQRDGDTAKASTSTRRGHSVLIDPADLQQVSLESWSSFSLDCRQQLDRQTRSVSKSSRHAPRAVRLLKTFQFSCYGTRSVPATLASMKQGFPQSRSDGVSCSLSITRRHQATKGCCLAATAFFVAWCLCVPICTPLNKRTSRDLFV